MLAIVGLILSLCKNHFFKKKTSNSYYLKLILVTTPLRLVLKVN